MYIHSFHWHVQNATIPCRSQELLPFLSIIYPFLPPISTNYSSILPHFILPPISWSTSQSCCFHIHTQYYFGNSIFKYIYLYLYSCTYQPWPKHVRGHYITKLYHKTKMHLLVCNKFYITECLICWGNTHIPHLLNVWWVVHGVMHGVWCSSVWMVCCARCMVLWCVVHVSV